MTMIDPITILYIDDDATELRRIKALLEASGRLRVVAEIPKASISANIESANLPNLFLIDYELSKIQDDNSSVDYNGTTLSAAIRGVANNWPVVLLSKKSLIDPGKRHEHLAEFQLIDEIIYKDSLGDMDSLSRIVDLIVSLSEGYQRLRDIVVQSPNWDGVMAALTASPEETEQLTLANPPLYPQQGRSIWTPSRLADWICHTVLEYPGILYDEVYAATALRISVESYLSQEVQAVFQSAKYTGVFSSRGQRWWKQRLERIAIEFVGDLNYADRFAEVFLRKQGIFLSPSVSIVRNESPADAVCYIYHKPVMFEYTVAYRPDNRPPIMEPARLSFKAIQQSNEFQREFVEGVDEELLRQIREMDL